MSELLYAKLVAERAQDMSSSLNVPLAIVKNKYCFLAANIDELINIVHKSWDYKLSIDVETIPLSITVFYFKVSVAGVIL